MSTVFSQIGNVVGAKIKTVELLVTTNTTAINKLNADSTVFGSFAKGDADTLATSTLYTDNKVSAITAAYQNAIAVETTARINAITNLTTSVDAESTRAQSAEAVLTTTLNGEISRAKTAEAVLTTALNGVQTFNQTLNTTSNVTFNNVLVNGVLNSDDITASTLTTSGDVIVQGSLTVNGTTTTVNTETLNVADNIIILNSDVTGIATQNAGIEVERGDESNVQLLWNETTNRWSVGSETFEAATLIGTLTGNSSTSTKLQTSRTISLSGDVSGSVSFDGSANASITSTLTNSGVTAGTYKSVAVDAKGRVTAGTNPTTLAGYGITDAASSSHTHTIANITDLGTLAEFDTALAAAMA